MIKSLAVIAAIILVLCLPCLVHAQTGMPSSFPDMDRGYQFSSETKVPSVVADDWICPSIVPTGLRWWGGYWTPSTPGSYGHYADGRPTVLTPGGIQSWSLAIYANVPQGGPEPYARPGSLITSVTLPTVAVQETDAGTTQNGRQVYSYFATLDQALFTPLTPGSTYWLSIETTMPATGVQWGWHESSSHDLSAAVQNFNGAGWLQIQNNMYDNDMAFQMVIPEPAGLSALGIGLSGLATMLLRRRR